MRKTPIIMLAAATVAFAACALEAKPRGTEPAKVDPQALVNARQGGMAMSVGALGAISAGVEKKAPARSYRLAANGLAHFAAALPALFDARTAAIEGTGAAPAIWTDKAGFAARAAQYRDAAAALSTAVAADDAAGIAAALASTKGACKACHDSYQTK